MPSHVPAAMLALAALLGATRADAADCAAATTQTDLTICADEAARASDARLNLLYKQVVARLDGQGESLALLARAQRAWIAFRDAECAFTASGSVGGSVYPMLVATCRDGLTRKRVADLQALLACPEGDLACPVPRP